MPITVPGKRSRTAAAITCAVECRRTSRFSLMAAPKKGSADYTEGIGERLNGAKTLEPGRDVLPAERSVVERRLDVGMDLEDDRELVRQGNDRRPAGLTSKPFLPVGVDGTAADAAVSCGCLLDGGVTSWTSADLERGGLLQTVNDLQTFPPTSLCRSCGPCRDRLP